MVEDQEGESRANDIQQGLQNEHYSKFDRIRLRDEYELVCKRKQQIERMAGFFKKKDNIFEKTEEKNLCPNCKGGTLYPEDWNWRCPKCNGTGKDKTDNR